MKYGVECSVFVSNCLIDMYGKCGYVADAIIVFRDMVEKDDISWNSILSANARNGKLQEGVAIFHQMPNRDTISYNELIDGIAKFGVVDEAIDVLLKMPSSNSSSWNSIITGYTNRGRNREALKFFCKMHSCGVRLDEFTLSSLLSGIARLSSILWGSSIHCCAIKNGLDGYVVVGSALTDMYFKCGKIQDGEKSFQLVEEKNLVTWNALISGYAHNGKSERVLELFATKDFEPDEITFLNVLSACWHSRAPLKIVNEYFEIMTVEYKIDPTPEHCSMMIRMMGNDGDVSGAEKMINELGFDSCGRVWKTLLAACVTCKNIDVAEVAAKKVMDLEGDDEFVYVMMSNIYAWYGKWEDVCSVREAMKVRNVRKEAGRSWIDVEERS
ncbi:hypothetical protein ACS0TY_013273 [Phlomoides rotata]